MVAGLICWCCVALRTPIALLTIDMRLPLISAAAKAPDMLMLRCLFVAIAAMMWAGPALAKQPNIILLFSDDAGYRDFGFQGSTEIRTPNLDRLAAQGMVFDQAYVAHPTCGPSRAGLLTGKFPARFGFEHNNVVGFMSENGRLVGDDMGLPLSEVTMAQRLRAIGYHTGLLGKWHQGHEDRYHPTRRGFDEFYGIRSGARDYWPYSEDKQPDEEAKLMERGFRHFAEHEGYLTDALAREAGDFLARNKDEPFFLFLSFTAPHGPLQARKEDLAQFPHIEGKRKTYAAMMQALDRAIGSVLNDLDRLGLSENTLVVFTNDNGGPHGNASNNYPLRGLKANYLEGGVRVPMVIRWPGHIEPGSHFEKPVSLVDLLPSFHAAGGGDNVALGAIDGVSLWPYLTGLDKRAPHDRLFWKRDVRVAYREDDWKLIRYPDRTPELYDLSQDVSEENNLAAQYPDRVASMFKALFALETEMDRPLWMLRREYDAADLANQDEFGEARLENGK